MIPPLLVSVRVGAWGRWWVPLVLLWPLLPLAMAAPAVLAIGRPRLLRRRLGSALGAYRCLCALRGLRIEAAGSDRRLSICIH